MKSSRILPNYLSSYFPFISNTLKGTMAYRLAFVVSLFSRFLTLLVSYYLWKAIYASSNTDVIRGFTFDQMTVYISVTFLISIMIGMSGGSIANNISWDVLGGNIAMYLIKPISYRGVKLSENIGMLISSIVTRVLPYYILFIILGFIHVTSISTMFYFLCSCVLSFLCMFYFGFCFGLMSFYTTYFFGLNLAMNVVINFFSGSLIPLTFLPEGFEKIIRILPFASLTYTPLMIYLEKVKGQELLFSMALQLAWILIFYILGAIIWKKAIKKLTIQGG